MTVLLTLYLVLVLGIWSKPRKHRSKETVRCASLRWCVDSNLQNHLNTEVWNSFLILSCLSVFWSTVGAHTVGDLNEILDVLKKMEEGKIFGKSDASLYVPDDGHFYPQECNSKLMYCYLLELYVIAREEEDEDAIADEIESIFHKKAKYENCSKIIRSDLKSQNSTECPECETHQVNSTVFYERMKSFLQKLQSITSTDCD